MLRLFGLFGVLGVVSVADDVVGYVEGLDSLLVAVEELQAHLVAAVLAGGVGYPRDVGVGEQVGVHLILLHGAQ